jgi:hypothetical protein
MPDVQEVFRMATQKVRPDPGALERQHRNQRWQVTKRKGGVYALVAGLVIAGTIIGIGALRDGDPGGPAAGEVLTTNDLIGTWVRSGTGDGDDFAFVKFNQDGTFAAGHHQQLLFSENAPAAGTYQLADGTITFVVEERSSACEPETWVWEATLAADGRLRTVSVEGTNCDVALDTETWVRISSGT